VFRGHAMKAGIEDEQRYVYSPLILTTRRKLINFIPRPFTPGNEHRAHLNMRIFGLQSLSGRTLQEQDILPLPGFEPQTAQPVA
jgi:hypothetical protein